jgi:hypothetical protein
VHQVEAADFGRRLRPKLPPLAQRNGCAKALPVALPKNKIAIPPLRRSVITLKHCGEKYFADDTHIGRQIKCKICGQVLTVARVVPTPTVPGIENVRADEGLIKRMQSRRYILLGLFVAIVAAVGITLAVLHRSSSLPGTPALSPSLAMGTSPTASVLPKRTPFSLPNGTSLHNARCPRGVAHVRISNGTDSDARVQLYSANSGTVCWDYYIRGGDQWTLSRVGMGTYRLRFLLGTDWDTRQKRFVSTSSASEFDAPLDFKEPQRGAKTSYNCFEATLHTIPLHNAPTHSVNESVFSTYDAGE